MTGGRLGGGGGEEEPLETDWTGYSRLTAAPGPRHICTTTWPHLHHDLATSAPRPGHARACARTQPHLRRTFPKGTRSCKWRSWRRGTCSRRTTTARRTRTAKCSTAAASAPPRSASRRSSPTGEYPRPPAAWRVHCGRPCPIGACRVHRRRMSSASAARPAGSVCRTPRCCLLFCLFWFLSQERGVLLPVPPEEPRQGHAARQGAPVHACPGPSPRLRRDRAHVCAGWFLGASS